MPEKRTTVVVRPHVHDLIAELAKKTGRTQTSLIESCVLNQWWMMLKQEEGFSVWAVTKDHDRENEPLPNEYELLARCQKQIQDDEQSRSASRNGSTAPVGGGRK